MKKTNWISAFVAYMRKELGSFAHAFRGIRFLLGDHNFYFHLPVGIAVLLVGGWFGVSREEFFWLLLGVFLVWTTEALNTAIEKLVDLAHPARHPLAGKVKDIAAAAVLLAVFFAGMVGLAILLPYAWQWLVSGMPFSRT